MVGGGLLAAALVAKMLTAKPAIAADQRGGRAGASARPQLA
jgi:hypothetical protein